jgi:small subunit ribosomal protein S17
MSEQPEETAADAPVADDAAAPLPGSEATAENVTQAAASSGAGSSAPAEVLPPKERRARARAAKAAKRPAGKERSPEERQTERETVRSQKASARRVERQRTRAKAKASSAGGDGAAPTAAREHVAGRQKTRQGVVVSDKAEKTITVRIDAARRHRRYEKIVRTSRTLHAHDETNDAHIGDTVIVREARPLSRTKRWRLVEVVERAK